MHQNDYFIVMLSQTLLHVSAYQRHHQGAHMIFTSYLYVGMHYRMNNGISSEVASISIVTLRIKVDVVNRCWKQWTVVEHGPTFHHRVCKVMLVYGILNVRGRIRTFKASVCATDFNTKVFFFLHCLFWLNMLECHLSDYCCYYYYYVVVVLWV
jgi:hypothetical protein